MSTEIVRVWSVTIVSGAWLHKIERHPTTNEYFTLHTAIDSGEKLQIIEILCFQ